jgi:hypothetical protein
MLRKLLEERKRRGSPEMKWQMEVERVEKQKNLTPDESVKGQMWRKLTDNQ